MSTHTTPGNALSYTRSHGVFASLGMRRKNIETDTRVEESDERFGMHRKYAGEEAYGFRRVKGCSFFLC